MQDEQIVELYWSRDESAVEETARKYGAYCHAIAYGVLQNREDAEEAVNDAYLGAWNSIPPHRPTVLSAFLGKLTRRAAVDKWRERSAAKRGGGELLSVSDIGERFGYSQSKVKSMLYRSREKLKKQLTKEGFL